MIKMIEIFKIPALQLKVRGEQNKHNSIHVTCTVRYTLDSFNIKLTNNAHNTDRQYYLNMNYISL